MFQIVAIPFDAFQALPRADSRWLLTCLVRYTDRAGRCWPSMRQLAADARMSLATVCRRLAELHRLGCFTRERRPGRRFVYVLAEAYRPRWPGRDPEPETAAEPAVSAAEQGVSHPGNASVSQAETQKANPGKQSQKADTRAGSLMDSEAFRWRARLRQWRESGLWVRSFGPLPGEPGCRVPAELLSTV